MANEKLKVETWKIDRLIPYARNPRKNDEQVDRMASAIKEFGFRIPIVAKSDGSVVDGHLRLKAAQKLGLKEVPVALADELTDAQVKAFRLLANRSASWAEWDNDILKLELDELKDMDYDLDLTGFESTEISALFDDASALAEDEKYTSKIASPQYEPTGEKVTLKDCFDFTHTDALLKEIEDANISDAEKAFLSKAAQRHTVFNYHNIAEYYAANASPSMQRLMEKSALVIIDFDDAIKNGFVMAVNQIDALCCGGER